MSDCIFCNIVLGKSPASVVYRDEHCTAFMDIQPVNAGHVLIVPNRHATYLADLDAETGAQMFRVAQQIAAALRNSGIKCEGVNFLLADGKAANQEVFHVHLHVIPRFQGDGFGFTFPSGYTEKPERSELDTTAQQIKQAL
ncbi:MAG TPA: HIT family protein [Abditibacteriaceae bacterium]|jgi:histidine triad (HIT) family protein